MDQWQGAYDDGWQGDIVPEAFSHPAKFSRGLIHRIYQHAKEMDWVKPGDYVLDPFGGVGLGALDAISMGLNWVGCELEQKFSELAQKNFIKWNLDLRGWPNLGTARMVNADSRNLKAVIEKADLVVSSPPFCDRIPQQDPNFQTPHDSQNRRNLDYGHTPGNLANMKEGDIDLICSSPPYAESQGVNPSEGIKSQKPRRLWDEYNIGHSPGQLGSMKEGSFDISISSPPYEDSLSNDNSGGIDWRKAGRPDRLRKSNKRHAVQDCNQINYSKNSNNLGNSSGDTFWSASKEIVRGCYELLKPGGHAIWVCKDYVKAGKRIPFSDRWLALCESVGFRLVCRHQAMLVKEHGTQVTIHGDEKITTERKSFFRRLAESKGSPRIDWEDVICMEKG